jgi:hypothetical protein
MGKLPVRVYMYFSYSSKMLYTSVMTTLLQKVVDKMQELPESSQNVLATWLLAKLSTDLEESLSNEVMLKLSESSLEFWNDPENDVWDSL